MRDHALKTIFIILPCYNEEDVLPSSIQKLHSAYMDWAGKVFSARSRIVFVDDGSTDRTWALIRSAHEEYPEISGIRCGMNRGHQNAILAGMMTVRDECDAVITLDCDLQDDYTKIPEFVSGFEEGNDVVYGIRSDRSSDTFMKRTTAQVYYRLLKKSGVETIYNHADFRLLSRHALDLLSEYREVNLYLRGLIPMLGLKSTTVAYKRQARTAGKSKYTPQKMFRLAVDGITSFTIRPIRFIETAGVTICIISALLIIWYLIGYLRGSLIPGWATSVLLILFFGGANLLAIGIVGEYVGKTYLEAKHRPRFQIEEYLK